MASMKLLNEIVELLSHQDGSLTDALLKTKVLMHRIGHVELVGWVNDELNGYPVEKEVPEYRVIQSKLIGHLQNSAWSHSNVMLPTGHLEDKFKKYFHESKMRESISVLEKHASSTQGHLTVSVPPEFHRLIDDVIGGGFGVTRMWIQMEPTQVLHCLTEIRSRLLDFVLGLQDELGEVDESNLKEAAKSIDAPTMFQNMVVGDNATIVIGNQNTTNVTNTIQQGDWASLADTLKQNGVSEEDVEELNRAIADDGPLTAEQGFGPSVKDWMKKMWTKAVDTSWSIELGIAGNLLSDALKAYYFG